MLPYTFGSSDEKEARLWSTALLADSKVISRSVLLRAELRDYHWISAKGHPTWLAIALDPRRPTYNDAKFGRNEWNDLFVCCTSWIQLGHLSRHLMRKGMPVLNLKANRSLQRRQVHKCLGARPLKKYQCHEDSKTQVASNGKIPEAKEHIPTSLAKGRAQIQ